MERGGGLCAGTVTLKNVAIGRRARTFSGIGSVCGSSQGSNRSRFLVFDIMSDLSEMNPSKAVLRLFLACLLIPVAGWSQEYEGKTLVEASLVADSTAAVPGRSVDVGLLLKTAPGWHTYWEYPGDAGLATTIEWELPEGVSAGPIQWPMPVEVKLPGDIVDYAYKGDVLLITTLQVPEDFSAEKLEIGAKVNWLVCEDICIPGDAELQLSLPVAAVAQAENTDLFADFRRQLPSLESPPFEAVWETTASGFRLVLTGIPSEGGLAFYPLPSAEATAGHPKLERDGESATVEIPVEPTTGPMRGVVTLGVGEDREGWLVDSSKQETRASSSGVPGGVPSMGLGLALLFGLIGGIILNVMPCVLPVISLKIFGFIRQAGDDPTKIWRHGLAYTGGVFLWFLGLAAIISGLRLAGEEVTWAFQFQNPIFIIVLSTIVFVFALNLAGVFEVILPWKANQAMDQAGAHEGYYGSFFQGIFATLLATPCTAPFLGSALGFAFTRSVFEIFAMFAAIAFGMALPFLVLSARPAWMKFLPKPGAWMERVKQFMAFPLFATTLWLLYVLGNQRGLEAVIAVSVFLLALGLAAWIYGSFCGPGAKRVWVSYALILVISVGTGVAVFGGGLSDSRPVGAGTVAKGGIPWVAFSQEKLDSLLAEGETVFVDFTADWCITCKVNERIAIDRPEVRRLIEETGTIPMKADWTNSDPEITAALRKFGRVGVPFYVIYPGGDADDPIVLPELLTEQMVVSALEEAFDRTQTTPADNPPALADVQP